MGCFTLYLLKITFLQVSNTEEITFEALKKAIGEILCTAEFP